MNDIVTQIGKLKLQGNIVDSGWFQNIRYKNGRVNMNAIFILSEIIYWYRPTKVIDETTGEVIEYRKKFKGDKLQTSYKFYEDKLGLTKGQAKLACKFLVMTIL
ncbi:hypothetical protein SH2C18_23140 [Clostridium sediminicola]|uniref:hypothetical protein n=1 Tax=Clostridium sediminicola TaxID=3114879 RepID=UPI0031F207E2